MFLRPHIKRLSRPLLFRPRTTPPTTTIASNIRASVRIMSTFKQEPHKLLVIPGPIEVTDEVLFANAHPPVAHTSPDFIPVFGDCIRLTREVLFTKDAQVFVIAGSGTLGWDQVSANLIEPGDDALVLNSGYFGDSFTECLQTYGAKVDEVRADFGQAVQQDALEKALSNKKYKLVTFTHVDTSTAVLSDAKMIADTVHRISPDTLVILDGVCSVASEDIRMDGWGIDVVMTASQKGLGCPPGLSVVAASRKAISVYEKRKTPVAAYYASWKKWIPIMDAYEAGRPMYFATPPVNIIRAYRQSLFDLARGPISLEQRFELHREAKSRVGAAVAQLGLKEVPQDPSIAANGMSAVYLPEGVTIGDLVPRMAARGVIVAGGLHKDAKEKYFRIGHMGITAVDKGRGDIDKIIAVLGEVVNETTSKQNV